MIADLSGNKALITKLTALPKKVEGTVIRQALRKAAKLEQDAIKNRAPVQTGLMKSKLTVRAMKRSRSRIGSRVIFKDSESLVRMSKAGKRYFYPAAVEYGHGTVQGTHFMKHGFESSKSAVLGLIVGELKAGIVREAMAGASK